MHDIELKNVAKRYGKTSVIENLNLTIKGGERLVLLGPSGCGKSTTLRMIAGLEEISEGQLLLDGKDATNTPSGLRDIAMVFQNYALYPHMTVEQNITFGLQANKVSSSEIAKRLDDALKMVGLEEYRDRTPADLSGGQRQRVSLARAVVKQSQYFLLDEPLSNLDVTLRQSSRNQLINIHNEFKQTFVYVTHDQVEAMTLGHRIALLNKGEIQMLGTPDEVYSYPKNMFTASFIGSPKMNLQTVTYKDGHIYVGSQAVVLDEDWYDILGQLNSEEVVMGVRPEHLTITPDETLNSFAGEVVYTENLGSSYAITAKTRTTEWTVITDFRKWEPGDTAYVNFDSKNVHFFNKDTEQSLGYPQSVKNMHTRANIETSKV